MIKPHEINDDGLPVFTLNGNGKGTATSWETNEDGLPIIKKKEPSLSLPSSKDYAGASTLFTTSGKGAEEGGQFVKTETQPEFPGDQTGVQTVGYKATDVPIGGGTGEPTEAAKTVAGIYNTLVGSAARMAGGFSQMGQDVDVAQRKKFNLLTGHPVNEGIEPSGTWRKESVEQVEKLRSPVSTKEEEAKLGQFDIKKKTLGQNIKAIAFSAPSMIADVMAGVETGGATFFAQGVNDASQELESNPETKDLPENVKLAYTYTNGIVSAALMKFNFINIFKGTGVDKVINKNITNKVLATFIKQGIKATKEDIDAAVSKEVASLSANVARFGAKTAVSALTGAATGAAMEASHKATQGLVNLEEGKEVFDTKNIKDDIVNAAANLGLFSALTGTTSSLKSNLDYIKRVKENVPHLPEEHQVEFVKQSLIEKLANENAENLTDPTLIKQQKQAAKEAHEVKTQILAGKNPDEIVTESQQKIIDQKEKAQTELERLKFDNDIANKKIDAKIEETDGRESEANRIKLQELKEEKRRTNEDYQKNVAKWQKEIPVEEEKPLPEDLLSKDQPKIESAIIEINGKVYEGKNHAEAILKAKDDGQDISNVDRKSEGKFKLSDGTIIDREEAKARFGQDRSELLIPQDEAAKQADKDYEKIKRGAGVGLFDRVKSNLSKPKNETPDEILRAKNIENLSKEQLMPEMIAQSIDAPTGVLNSLNGDRELAIDLIAQNKTEDIKSARKKWAKIDSEKADDNVKLLEEGLERQSKQQPEKALTEEEIKAPTEENMPKKKIESGDAVRYNNKIYEVDEGFDENGKINWTLVDKNGKKYNVPESKIETLTPKESEEYFSQFRPLKNETIPPTTKSPEQIPPSEKTPAEEPTIEAGKGAEPPKGEGEQAAVGLPEKMVGIKHEATENIRNRYNLPEYERNNKTNIELETEADAAIKEGYNVEKLIRKVEGGTPPTGVENIILTKYIGALDAEFESTKSDATLKEIQRILNATDKIGSLQSEAFRTRKALTPSDNSLASFFLREMDAMGVSELTDAQKTKIQKEWDDIERAKNEYNAYVFQKESELAGREIAAKIAAESKTGTRVRKTDKEFSDERKQIITDIKEKLKKARGETSATILPYAKELVAISPDVAKLVKNLVQQGVVKIEEVIDKVHGILVEDIKDISKDDVRDLIAGKYQEKKQTRNQLAKTLYELRQEAKLLGQLDDALRGEPKTEKAKIQRNQRLEEIRKQIKDVQDFDREVEAQKLAKVELAAKEKTATEKELTKAEKELAKKTPEQKAIETTKIRLLKEIEKIEGQIKKGDFAKEEKKEPIKLDEEGRKLKDKLIKLRTEREVRIMKEQYENRNKYEKARDFVIDKLNVPRTIMASMDYSAPFRQGLVAGISHPRTAAKSFSAMFKASISQKNFDRWVHDNRESPRFEIQNKSGLAVTDPHSPFLAAKEEQFMNNTAEKIPLFGRLIKGSERAYVMYLNKMRVDLFNRFADRFEEQGKTFDNSPQLYKAMATLINNETGRGNLGAIEAAAPVLNTVFFSPRLIASRVNLLTNWANPHWYKNTPKEVRIMYMKDMLKFIGLGTSVLALMKYGVAGSKDDKDKVTVETDPRSSDFGKIKSGNTRWDIWGGFQQYIRLVTQLALGEKKSTGTGEIQELDSKGRFGEGRGDVALRFVRGKLAPVPSMAMDIFQGRNVQGQEVSTQQELIQHLTPLIYSDVQQAMQDKGVSSLFTVGVPSIFGVGVQTYQPTQTKPKTFKIYSGTKAREVTPEEYKKYETDREDIFKKKMRQIESRGTVWLNKFGEITIDEKKKRNTKPFNKLTPDERKEFESRIREQAGDEAKDKINF